LVKQGICEESITTTFILEKLTFDSKASRTDLSNLAYISESAVGALSNAATTN